MSGAFGMHRVYWAHRSSTVLNEDGQRRHVYDLRGTHRPSCGWDGGMAVINEEDGYAVFQATTWNSKSHVVRRTRERENLPRRRSPRHSPSHRREGARRRRVR